MTFYTSVHRYRNKILYRGYTENGTRIHKRVDFSPTLYFPVDKETGWKSLDGKNVMPMGYDSINEASNALKQHGEIDNSVVYGNSNFVAQFIQNKFPGVIKFNPRLIDVGNIDIEVASDDGFPHPEEAAHPVISIAYKSRKSGIYHVWGMGDYDYRKSELNLGEGMIQYVKCSSEAELLRRFLVFWKEHTPDIITGWNIRLFDIPYIINRMRKVLGESDVNDLSPWKVLQYRQIGIKGKSMDAYEIYGVAQMDYFDLFQKFGYSYGTQESYSLDHIASVVLGERKLSYEEHGSLHSLYKNDYQKFIDYNIRDVDLVDRIDAETGLMDLALVIAYKGGVNYPDVFGTTGIWDSITYRYLADRNIAVPPTEEKMKSSYPGGFVKEPKIGMSKWVVSFDLNSLYPNLIVQYNMSPETLVEQDVYKGGVDYYLEHPANDVPYAVAANGSFYRKDNRGFLPEIIIGLYDERKATKKKMLETQQKNEESPSDDLKIEINKLNNTQMAVKILLNSLYGALGNQYFRYFDLRMAEGITLSGQLSIRWAEKAMNEYMNNILGTEDRDFVIAIDTDSLYVDMSTLVDKVNPSNPVKFLDKACSEKFEPMLEKAYGDLFTRMNGYENRMVMAREAIADRGVWVAKKRYILNVHNNEGVQYAKPKIKVMGLEAVKSSTPQYVRNKFSRAYEIILNETESELQKFVSECYEEFKSLPPEDVSFPRGVSDIDKWHDSVSIYKKGTPIHVRGSLVFNMLMKKHGLDKVMDSIKNGSKIKFCYTKMPNPTKENVIAFPQYLPKEIDMHRYIDYQTQFSKSFREPLSLVTNAVGWELERRATLEEFFA